MGARLSASLLVFVLATGVLLHLVVGLPAARSITEPQGVKNSIVEIPRGFSGKSGSELTSYLSGINFKPAFADTSTNWVSYMEAVNASNFSMTCANTEDTEIFPVNESLPNSACSQGGWDASTFSLYKAEMPLTLKSRWSNTETKNASMFFLVNEDETYAAFDLCEIEFAGTVFLDVEGVKYEVQSKLSESGFVATIHCPSSWQGRQANTFTVS